MNKNTSVRRIGFKTLGCKLNQSETESVASAFKNLGWEIGNFDEEDNVLIINSCTVTNAADRKSRSAINQALRMAEATSTTKTEPALVILTGCYADSYRETLESESNVYVVGNDHKHRIPELVDAHFRGEMLPGRLEGERDPFGYPMIQSIFRTRAMIKVQDGCDNYCSFCIIPYVRGRAISRPLSDTVKAVEKAAESGYREIVLTGVNMSRWNDGKKSFAHLLEACLSAKGEFRLRLGSLEPDSFGDDIISLMMHDRMTPHMHLCLQSGSDKILKAMKRQYTVEKFAHIAKLLRYQKKFFNLSTDVIVGFPGESEQDFSETVALCKQLEFSHIHTFPYSRRTGTFADSMPQQVPESVKKERAEHIRKISVEGKRKFREGLINTFHEVLIEQIDTKTGFARGITANYTPVRLLLPIGVPPESFKNRPLAVRIRLVEPGEDPDLIGTLKY